MGSDGSRGRAGNENLMRGLNVRTLLYALKAKPGARRTRSSAASNRPIRMAVSSTNRVPTVLKWVWRNAAVPMPMTPP